MMTEAGARRLQAPQPNTRIGAHPSRFGGGSPAAAVLALVVRLAFGFLYWTGKPMTQDEREYLQLGRTWRQVGDWSTTQQQRAPARVTGRSAARPVPALSGWRVHCGQRRRSAGRRGEIGGRGRTGRSRADGRAWRRQGRAVSARRDRRGAAGAGHATGSRAGGRGGAGCAAALYPPLVWTTAYAFKRDVVHGDRARRRPAVVAGARQGRIRPLRPVFAAGLLAAPATLTRPAMPLLPGTGRVVADHATTRAAVVVLAGRVAARWWRRGPLAIRGARQVRPRGGRGV